MMLDYLMTYRVYVVSVSALNCVLFLILKKLRFRYMIHFLRWPVVANRALFLVCSLISEWGILASYWAFL